MRPTEFDDPAFLERLRQGESTAYRQLIRRLHGSLVGVAASIIGSRAQGEEIVQDAWLAVFSGISRFEGRSSLTTWVFSIVMNRARTRAGREGRLVGLPALLDGTNPAERAVPLAAFKPDGHWVEAPRLWDEIDPERIIGGRQLWSHVQEVIERLPGGQKAVIILRDMEGCTAEEACELLGISSENQRVLLHRARGRIRQAIDSLTAIPGTAAPDTMARPASAVPETVPGTVITGAQAAPRPAAAPPRRRRPAARFGIAAWARGCTILLLRGSSASASSPGPARFRAFAGPPGGLIAGMVRLAG
jgi:RNA polymerase sigma-70 factor, ECF subfamily